MLGNKSTIRTSLIIVALGIGALLILVWLSRSPIQVPKVDATIHNAAVNTTDVVNSEPKLATSDGVDPFKEQLSKQQANKSGKVNVENITPLVPIGTDPFKEKLNLQSKQATQVTVSPFKN